MRESETLVSRVGCPIAAHLLHIQKCIEFFGACMTWTQDFIYICPKSQEDVEKS